MLCNNITKRSAEGRNSLTVYADIYFVLNFVADMLICFIYSKVLHLKTNMLRILCASLAGALGAVIQILFSTVLISVLLSFLLPGIMIFILSGGGGVVFYLKGYVLIFGTSFVMGGIIFSLSQLLAGSVSKKLLVFILFASLFFCFYYFDIFNTESRVRSVEVEVRKERKKEKYKLLCDTGCLVREPFSGLPVILLSPRSFDRLFCRSDLMDTEFCVRYKKRPVPIKTAAGSTVIYAVMPDEITYFNKNKKCFCNAMVARSENDSFAGYDGIFPENLI